MIDIFKFQSEFGILYFTGSLRLFLSWRFLQISKFWIFENRILKFKLFLAVSSTFQFSNGILKDRINDLTLVVELINLIEY